MTFVYLLHANLSAHPIRRRSLMKKKIMMVAMMFFQMFFTSENVQAAEIESIESGKGYLCPADNSD